MSWRRQPELVALALGALAAVALAVGSHGHHLGGVPGLVASGLSSLLLFAVCGDGLAVALTPESWRPARPAVALALGATASGLVLTGFGYAHVPLQVSLWLTLALGIGASVWVRRRFERPPVAGSARTTPRLSWLAALLVIGCIGVLPALITGQDTVPGQNPDAHQVVGIAVLFQHVPPTGTDDALPIDTVPPSWRFRYSIFYPLAGASSLFGLDPIRVFPAMSALLMALAAAGFALLAVTALGAPKRAGPPLAILLALAWVPLHLAWHPYWNQLWGFALFPYALAFGWRAVLEQERASWIGFWLVTFALALAYPLAMPYPLVLVAITALAYRRRPRLPRLRSAWAWAGAVLGGLVALVFIAAALTKLGQGLDQIFKPHSALWSGDITHLTAVGRFGGTGGGVLAAAAVVVIAAAGLRDLPRRLAVGLGATVTALLLLDLRFRLVRGGAYMDFKHLSYVGIVVLALAAAAVARWLTSSRRTLSVAAVAIAVVWTVAALRVDRREAIETGSQVTPELLQIRSWAAHLPHGASVRVDIPPAGDQLWAVYMLGDHPVDAPAPLLGSTYAHAPYGFRADYSLARRYVSSADPNHLVPVPAPAFTVGPPLYENDRYVVRRIVWPTSSPKLAKYPDTASTTLVEP